MPYDIEPLTEFRGKNPIAREADIMKLDGIGSSIAALAHAIAKIGPTIEGCDFIGDADEMAERMLEGLDLCFDAHSYRLILDGMRGALRGRV